MSNSNYHLFNKNASTIIFLSKIFMQLEIGDKLPTFEQLSKDIGVARGTIQNSLKIIQDEGAITIHARGHMGTFLVEKDTKKLVQLADMRSLLGAMPMPYSKIFEGLATGLISTLKNKYGIPVNMAYMRDASERINAMLEGNYDFVVLSKASAIHPAHDDRDIYIAIDLGPQSYMTGYVLVFAKDGEKSIQNGMRVGVANGLAEHEKIIGNLCVDKQVEIVKVEYDKVLQSLKNKEIDVTVWNKDEINDLLIQVNTVALNYVEHTTTAVILVDKNRPELIKLLQEIVDVEMVRSIQTAVIQGDMQAKY